MFDFKSEENLLLKSLDKFETSTLNIHNRNLVYCVIVIVILKIIGQCVINRIAIHVKLIRYVLICFDICCVHVRKLL